MELGAFLLLTTVVLEHHLRTLMVILSSCVSFHCVLILSSADFVAQNCFLLAGSEDPVMFNGADAEGASWRGLVPVAVWPERTWFDVDGNFLGVSGGHDLGRTTVTR